VVPFFPFFPPICIRLLCSFETQFLPPFGCIDRIDLVLFLQARADMPSYVSLFSAVMRVFFPADMDCRSGRVFLFFCGRTDVT